MKRVFALLLTLALTAGLLSACGGDTQQASTPETGGQIDVLRIACVPSLAPEQILAAAEPLKDLLKTELAASGYEVGAVEITVGETYEAVAEALGDGTVDVAVGMPGGTYVLYDDRCDVILTSTRAGLNKDFDDAKDWNDQMATVPVDGQTVFYRSLIIAGPSDAGAAVAAKVNAGLAPDWEDLDALIWGVMNTSSSAGYIYPSLWLQERYGKSVADLSYTVSANSYADLFAELASGEIDVLVCYADARRDHAARWEEEFGRGGSIWEETNVIGVTPGIYNDTITVSKSSEHITEGFIAALQDAFIRIAEADAGREAIAVYSHEGYQKAVSADYDNERAAQELMQGLQSK